MKVDNAIRDLHLALSHASYEGFPEVTYEDRDWEHYHKTKENKYVKKKRKHSESEIIVYAMFPQMWSSTALGFGGLGGQAMTTAYVIVLKSDMDYGFCVYFGGRFAYRVEHANNLFFEHINKHNMASVKDYKQYEIT